MAAIARPLHVLHVSTYDTMGGAARSARRIHEGIHNLGHDSRMLVWRKASDDSRIQQFNPRLSFPRRVQQKIRRNLRSHQMGQYAGQRRDLFQPFSDDRTDQLVDLLSLEPLPDVVSLFWIAGFPDIGYFFHHLPPVTPVVWRLSDMNPFTGGCHYAWDCRRWTRQCGKCPELGSQHDRDLSQRIWVRKQRAYGSRTIHVVATNSWMASEVAQSSLLGKNPVTVIPNGLDSKIFSPQDRARARHSLGLPQDKSIILAVSDHLHDQRKGFRYLAEALALMAPNPEILLVKVGSNRSEPLLSLPVIHTHLGRIEDDSTLAKVYASADIFVAPYVFENLPNTILESMACGTPVVAFRTGGIPDVVLPGRTGLLSRWSEPADLAAQLQWMLDHPAERLAMGNHARRMIEEQYTQEIEAQRFVELYLRILGQTEVLTDDKAN